MKMSRPHVELPLPARRVGRPALSDAAAPSVPVHLRLDAAEYDRVYRLAVEQRCTVPEVIRRAVKGYDVPRGTSKKET
jgi:hypothetical protein